MFGRVALALAGCVVVAGHARAEANLFCIAADRGVERLQFQAVMPDDKSRFSTLEGALKTDLFGETAFGPGDVKLFSWTGEIRMLVRKTLPDGKEVEIEILAIDRSGPMDYGGGYFVRYGGATVSGRIACTGG